ncbi:aldehyde ferredoxin oxidoreductase C-terminal domain-containing protein [Halorubrum ezzemoulense]|uniref:aldehyde ferredoxin oxidoreductase family protein n=1 Tax=Halorubrum ezzemoulense TaxID=337243 RepID=UPI00232A7AA3|nr:aldehyde ferredoxin oxidoreductase C-terminal domain-containing protein [Halorubrum ezzemoulense]MDB2280578.1 aldehyde ferredoxin oxidoreductase C-terminal domain-containing protein [Halorubrum ezzemoulense]
MRRNRTRVIRVDLSTRETTSERVPRDWRRDFVGGKGIGARYLYEELSPGTDPTGPENLLAFLVGPLAGFLPGETRYAAVTKSPLTGGFLDSYAGGDFAVRLAGSLDDYIGLLVTGTADRPVRIEVEGGRARVKPTDAWGDDAAETADRFPDAGVACVGPAGEREAAYATIASDGGDHHAGRGGAGAVMGAKRLKAVVARDPPPAVPDDLAARRDRDAETYGRRPTGEWQAAGETIETVDYADEVGILAAEGWTETGFDGVDDIGVEAAAERAAGREAVSAGRDGDGREGAESGPAAVPGGFRIDTPDGEVIPRGAAPITLGAGLGIDDFDRVAELCGVCDRLGLDVIGAGSAVAWAIRAGRAGVVDCPVDFGDAAGAEHLLKAIAARDPPADLDVDPDLPDALADGVDAAVAQFGGDALVPTVKSMALPGFDPRAAVGVALAYATSDRGACHRRARPQEREPLARPDRSLADRVRDVVGEQNARSVLWSLVVDDFVGEAVCADLGAEWLAAIEHPAVADCGGPHRDESERGDAGDAGRPDPSPAALATTGERIWTLTRLFNAREGFDRADDALPEPLRTDAADGTPGVDVDAFDRLLDRYYAARGWGERGLPTPETAERLGLARVVDDATPLDDSPIDSAPAADADD